MEINITCFATAFKTQVEEYFKLHTQLVSNFVGQWWSKAFLVQLSQRVTNLHAEGGSVRLKGDSHKGMGAHTGQICASFLGNHSFLAAPRTPGLLSTLWM